MVLSVTLSLTPAEHGEKPRPEPRLVLAVSPSAFRIRRRLEPEESGRPWLLELEIDVKIPDPEAVLAGSEGFLVDGVDGGELGVVDDVESGPDGAVTALVVVSGWFGRRRARIPVEAIEAVVPAERRIVVRR